MNLSEKELDLTTQKINNLEMDISKLNDQINLLADHVSSQIHSLKETQRFLVKLATNQQELTKRIAAWPYLVINNNGEDLK